LNITDLVSARQEPFQPWKEGRTIPWDEPGFSKRMLREHLSQAHDGASRRSQRIEEHVAFINSDILPFRRARVLDLGCGPGLYALRLVRHGHDCTGIDFGPASIDYAREEAATQGLACSFVLGDIRDVEFGEAFDLVMLLFGELNLFTRDEVIALLRRCSAALAPGGSVLLEVHSSDAVRRRGLMASTWSAPQSGLFSERPHLRLDESFWLDEQRIAGGRHWIVDAATSEVWRHAWTMQAYSDAEYEALLSDAGLELTRRYDSLTGKPDNPDFPVLLAAPR
jgi:SAM-dependent methyltransferase